MLAYSKEMRRDVLAACDRGEGPRAVALRFKCSESWVRRVKQERRELGKTAPLLTRRRVPRWEVHRERIFELIAERPDMTLRELKEALATPLCLQTLCVALAKLKLALKKSPPGGRTRSTRRGRAARRMAGSTTRAQSGASRLPR
jgi:transposase